MAPRELEYGNDDCKDIELNECVLAVKKLKSLTKSSGLRLSSNAFIRLNVFTTSLLKCLGRRINSQVTTFKQPVPLSIIRSSLTFLHPTLNEWWESWNNRPRAEISQLLIKEEVEGTLRMVMSPLMEIDGMIMTNLIRVIGVLVEWLVNAVIKVAQARGMNTLRKAEVEIVLENAPICRDLGKHLNPLPLMINNEHISMMPMNLSSPMLSSPCPSSSDPSDDPSISKVENSKESCFKKPILQQRSQSSEAIFSYSEREYLPPIEIFTPSKTKALSSPGKTRIIACIDPHLPWVKVKQPDLEGVILYSRGVETDMEPPLPPPIKEPDAITKMQSEVEMLKDLVNKLLSTR